MLVLSREVYVVRFGEFGGFGAPGIETHFDKEKGERNNDFTGNSGHNAGARHYG